MIDTLKQIVHLLDIVKFVYFAIGTVTGFVLYKVGRLFQKRRLHIILGFNKNTCEILMPIRYGNLEVDEGLGIDHKYKLELPLNYTTFEEASALIAIPKMLHLLDNNADIIFCDPRKRERFEETLSPYNNKFCIGSPTANQYVGSLFNPESDARILKKAFLLGCSKEVANQTGRDDVKNLRINIESDSEHKLYYGLDFNLLKQECNCETISKSSFSYSDDYIIVVKLCPSDFNFTEHGCTIIAFGNSADGTKTAVNFFTNYTKKFYQILKRDGNLDHYFYLFRCTSKGEVDFRENSYKDLTSVLLE